MKRKINRLNWWIRWRKKESIYKRGWQKAEIWGEEYERYLQWGRGSTGNSTIIVSRLVIKLPLSGRCPFRWGEIVSRSNVLIRAAQRIATLHRNWRQVLTVGITFHPRWRSVSSNTNILYSLFFNKRPSLTWINLFVTFNEPSCIWRRFFFKEKVMSIC